MRAEIESIEINGKTIRKGSNIVLNFSDGAWGDIHETVEKIYMDSSIKVDGECMPMIQTTPTNFCGPSITRPLSQLEESMK